MPKSAGFVSLAGKASLVSHLGLFEFHGKSCVGKGAISTETSSRAFYCMEGECEQIVMKLRLRFKDSYNN